MADQFVTTRDKVVENLCHELVRKLCDVGVHLRRARKSQMERTMSSRSAWNLACVVESGRLQRMLWRSSHLESESRAKREGVYESDESEMVRKLAIDSESDTDIERLGTTWS